MDEKIFIAHSCELNPEWEGRYKAGLLVTKDGISTEKSRPGTLRGGRVDEEAMQGVSVESDDTNFSTLLADGGQYAVRDSVIRLRTDSDGSEVCDFIGLGSAVCAFNGARVTVERSEIETVGVGHCAIYADNGSDLVVKDSKLRALGGRLYENYPNCADFNIMVAPPWVLGIMGSARGTNLMGKKSSTVLVNSELSAANWGVISTDNGQDNLLEVIDCTLTLEGSGDDKANPYFRRWGSGYGSYILGCHEEFRGVKMYCGTYIGIARDGSAVYRSSRGPVCVRSPRSGEVLYEGEGQGRICELYSDAFGIMTHGFSDLRFCEGTVMETENASFLLRSGGVNIDVSDGTKLIAKDGVILQIIDDDDTTVGVDWDSPIELHFHTEFNEKAGWPSENGQISTMMPPLPAPPPPEEGEESFFRPPTPDVHFRATDVQLNGNFYNGSGYYGQKAKQLYMTLGSGAVLTGAIAATETIHVDENGRQNTHFTINEYYYLGRVINRNYYNGENDVELTMEAGSRWQVTEPSLLSLLCVCEGAELCGRVLLDGQELAPEAGKVYRGEIRILPL